MPCFPPVALQTGLHVCSSAQTAHLSCRAGPHRAACDCRRRRASEPARDTFCSPLHWPRHVHNSGAPNALPTVVSRSNHTSPLHAQEPPDRYLDTLSGANAKDWALWRMRQEDAAGRCTAAFGYGTHPMSGDCSQFIREALKSSPSAEHMMGLCVELTPVTSTACRHGKSAASLAGWHSLRKHVKDSICPVTLALRSRT